MNNEKDCDTTLIANGLRDILPALGGKPAQAVQAAIELIERVPGYLAKLDRAHEAFEKRDAFVDQLLEAAGIDGQDYDNAPQIIKSQMAALQDQAKWVHSIGHAVGLLGGQSVSLAVDKVRELVGENEQLNARIMHVRDQLGINYASVGDVRLEADKIGMLCAERDNLEGIVQKLRKRSGETPEDRAGIAPAVALELSESVSRALVIIEHLTQSTLSCGPVSGPVINLAELEGQRHG